MNHDVLCVISAFQRSTTIPRKYIRELGDLPLVAHAMSAAEEAAHVSDTFVATDAEEIAQIATQYDITHHVLSSQDAKSDSPDPSVIARKASEYSQVEADYLLWLYPDIPLLSAESLDDAIEMTVGSNTQSVVFVRENGGNHGTLPMEGVHLSADGGLPAGEEGTIYEDVGAYLLDAERMLTAKGISPEPRVYEIPDSEAITIDTYGDWLHVENTLDRDRLVYYVRGNSEIGSGHINRGITIADQIFENDIEFAVPEGDDLAIELLEQSNYPYWTVSDDKEFLDRVRENPPDVIANDILNTDAEFVKQQRETGARIVNFEDIGSGAEHADAVVNALYEYSDPPANHHYGFKYFSLRNEFRYATPHSSIGSVDRIMVSFGGTDENNLTARTLEALIELDTYPYIDVVVGLGYTKQDTLDPIIERYPERAEIEVTQHVSSMAQRMEMADLLITSNGRTLYEAASLNLPTISVAQNQREQHHPYAYISRGVDFLGRADYVTEMDIRNAVKEYLTNETRREQMCAALAEHDIVNGVNRIKQLLFDTSDDLS